jgi:hypothetical protein
MRLPSFLLANLGRRRILRHQACKSSDTVAIHQLPALLTGIGRLVSIGQVANLCICASVLTLQLNNQRSTPVSEPTVAEATDSIYASLQANNADIDAHIATLKAALTREGMKEAVFDPAKLAQNNRSGRKLMQAYFRQRGVSVKFSAERATS